MLKTDYNIPIFEDTDAADLNKYSNEMANALKTQINNTNNEIKEIDKKVVDAVDKFTEPLSYKGQLSTIQDLPISATNGDIYNVTSENKNYIYNGTNWVEYSSTLDLTYLENNTKEVSEELKEVTENKRIKLEGKSEQDTRSGKNKLKIENFIDRTTNGVTFTAKYDTNGGLEYINATGNSTTGYKDIIRVDISSLPAGNYIINGLGTNKVIRYVLLKQGDTDAKIINTNTDVAFTQDSSSPYVAFRIDLCQAGEIDCQIKPMIRLSTETDNTYEPYGVSPSPDYPSRIRNIGDNIQLFDKGSITESQYINPDDGTVAASSNSNNSDYIRVFAGEKLVLSYDFKTLKNEGLRTFAFYDKNKTFLKGVQYNSNNTTKSFYFTSDNDGYARFTYDKNCVNIKLKEGSTATPYTEYGCGSIDYLIEDMSNNVFNKDTDIELDGQYRDWHNGSINANQYHCGIKIKVESNSIYKVYSNGNYSNLCYFNNNMTYLSGEVFGKNANKQVFTTPKNCKYITLAIEKTSLQSFAMYRAQEIHFPLSEGQLLHEGDYVDSTGIYLKRDKYTFSINDNWEQTNNKVEGCYTLHKPTPLKKPSLNYISHCTNLIGVNGTNYEKKTTPNSIGISADRFNVYIPNATTVDMCKSIMANQTVEYELAEEIVTPLTKEQIEAYYELQKAKYVNKMTLTCLNEIKPTLTDIDKSLEESLLDVEKLLAMLSLNS